MYTRNTDPTPENIRVELPPELAEPCERTGLRVLWAPFGGDQAVLWDIPAGEEVRPHLFVDEAWPMERVEWTVRQSLAELGVAGFEEVPVEPFGRLP